MAGVVARIQAVGDAAHDRILDMMLSGVFSPGETLQERRLADMLGMSRTPVREALQRLEMQGMVERTAGRCTMFTEPSVRTIVEVFNVRRLLEVQAAGLAARNGISAEAVDALRGQLDQLCSATRPSFIEHWRADEALHLCIAEAAGNSTLCSMIVALRRRSHIASWQRLPEDLREGATQAIDLLDTIRAGQETRARELMRRHIDEALEIVLQQLIPGRASRVA